MRDSYVFRGYKVTYFSVTLPNMPQFGIISDQEWIIGQQLYVKHAPSKLTAEQRNEF